MMNDAQVRKTARGAEARSGARGCQPRVAHTCRCLACVRSPVIAYHRVAPTALLRAQSTALSYRQHLPPGASFRLGPLPRALCQDARPTPFWPQFQKPRVRAYARTLPSPDLAFGASQSVPDCAEAQGAHGNLHSEKPPAKSSAALVPKDARPADLAAHSAPSWPVPRLAAAFLRSECLE